MSTRKKYLGIVVVATALVGSFLVGYGKKTGGVKATDTVDVCTKCGQIKGCESCCKPNQATCSMCSLVKDSPGCCKISKGAKTAAICTKCGQIKDSELCCKPNQTTCPKCTLVKDSPGCCNIPQK